MKVFSIGTCVRMLLVIGVAGVFAMQQLLSSKRGLTVQSGWSSRLVQAVEPMSLEDC